MANSEGTIHVDLNIEGLWSRKPRLPDTYVIQLAYVYNTRVYGYIKLKASSLLLSRPLPYQELRPLDDYRRMFKVSNLLCPTRFNSFAEPQTELSSQKRFQRSQKRGKQDYGKNVCFKPKYVPDDYIFVD